MTNKTIKGYIIWINTVKDIDKIIKKYNLAYFIVYSGLINVKIMFNDKKFYLFRFKSGYKKHSN
jgi:hypothetical protein